MAASSDLPGLDCQGLWDLKRYYDARLPEDVRLVPIPQKLASDAAQTWLVQNLQVPELLNISNGTNFADQLSIGAIPWRKAFWKRIVRQIEDEISSESDGYVGSQIAMQFSRRLTLARLYVKNELNEDIIIYLSELIAIPLSNATLVITWHPVLKHTYG